LPKLEKVWVKYDAHNIQHAKQWTSNG